MQAGIERLLEVSHGLAVGRSRHGLLPRLPEVRQGLVPHLTAQGMVGEAFDLLGAPIPSERFEGLDDVSMEASPPLLEHTAVGYLVGQGMLEGVFGVGKEPRFVEKLGCLEVREATGHGVFGQFGNGLQQRQGHLCANDRRRLQELFLLQR